MDKVEILVTAGKGGDGVVSFWREKFKPFGGPDGGDGGKGGDVYLLARSGEQDLSYFRNKKIYKAESGRNGEKQKKHGRDGNDLYIDVPVGTTVYGKKDDTIYLMADLKRDEQVALVARGGKGGLGNVHFASSTRKTPQEATSGKPGEKIKIVLEHKLIADVCLIGLPNSGKSSLLLNMTSTSPKIADYPFTTVSPIMGKVDVGFESFTVAEMPSLTEGSHKGKGLGNKFLRHCERARILLFIIDGNTENPARDLNLLKQELGKYSDKLLKKLLMIAVNKIDMSEVAGNKGRIDTSLKPSGLKVYYTSAKTGEGIEELITSVNDLLKKLPVVEEQEDTPEFVFRPKPLPRRKS